ncbi:hypothetical protein N781_04090 [Pontibacillus halophilus JSM 076056 = DSM 19796]|uniref:Uncharacterized protein n=2 Tax=Pontibacillus TaxID=289201 RepID=A0A0A5GEQ4_9BACI|nr:hypothetical protein N781_04090 [Pontibacillus halophilus JSM 076056 = DSM 19796]
MKGGTIMTKANEPIESLYHKVYETLDELHQQVIEAGEDVTELNDVDLEKLDRTNFALQLSKDVLENFVDTGKSMTINYDKRSVTIENPK